MRRGVSLLEVMFAIGVLAIALAAVLSVFVVAGGLAKKGETADVSAIVGRKAIADFRVRGMDVPHNWLTWDSVSSSYQPVPLLPVAQLRQTYAVVGSNTIPMSFPSGQPVTVPVYVPSGFVVEASQGSTAPQGVSLCIDPRFIAATAGTSDAASSFFPYVPKAGATDPRLARVTLANFHRTVSDPVVPMSKPMADSLFMFEDDLVLHRPADKSLPSFGSFNGDRVSHGEFSWIATVVQDTSLGLPAGQVSIVNPMPVNADQYVLSVVVFRQRPTGFDVTDPLNERVAGIDWVESGGTGLAGGETLLFAATEEALKVRTGQWIMLLGNYRHASGVMVPTARWFRVTEADDPNYHTGDSRWECNVSLAGGDWFVDSITEQQAVIVEGAVAVFEKTIKLDF